MKRKASASRSIVRQLARHYLIVSILPLILLLLMILTGAFFTRNYLTHLITQSSYELNHDAERSLQQLGEQIIQAKARDVARQIELYFRMHPHVDIRDMRKDPVFIELAMQKVGQTGYTSIYEAGTWIFRVHPNQKLIDQNVTFLAKDLPSWWAIVEQTHSGDEASGYYDWRNPDGSIHKKYMTITPAKVRVKDKIMMIAATTYIDEFSMPVLAMKQKADTVVATYQHYILRQIIAFSGLAIIIVLLTFSATYFWGRRAGFRFIEPITHLADTARNLGEGNWDVQLPEPLLARDDEIGVMAQSFLLMSQQLKETFDNLEQRVAELRRTQAALKLSEVHYRSLFDGIPVGLFRSTPDGIFLDVNPALTRMLGYKDSAKLIAVHAQDLYYNPDDRADWMVQMQTAGSAHAYELRMLKYDGTPIWVESDARTVYTESGDVLYFEGSLKDNTDRRLADEALKRSEENFKALYEESRRAQEVYRSLINSSADAIVIYDLDGCATYVSPMFTKIFDWSSEELIGKRVPFVPESEKEATLGVIRKVVDHGIPLQAFETRRTTKDGRVIDINLSASRYNDHEGRPAGMLVILRDISAAKRLEEHLQQVERLEAIGTLAGGVAHDFNNLLMVIQGTVSLLLYSTQISDDNYKHYVNIEKQVNRGSRLTRQLLGYARKGKYDVKPLQLNDVITESAETLRQTRKDIRIHYHLAGDLLTMEADVYQMEQVILNLFLNAADAMSAGGSLTLTTRNLNASEIPDKLREARTGAYILLTVEDTGIGMDRKTMDRIFEPFFTTKAVNKGTGLGLASVYGIVKGHGGAIDVSSDVGAGTTFSIYLPASDKPVSVHTPPQKKTLRGKGTILLIDDEKPVLEVSSAAAHLHRLYDSQGRKRPSGTRYVSAGKRPD